MQALMKLMIAFEGIIGTSKIRTNKADHCYYIATRVNNVYSLLMSVLKTDGAHFFICVKICLDLDVMIFCTLVLVVPSSPSMHCAPAAPAPLYLYVYILPSFLIKSQLRDSAFVCALIAVVFRPAALIFESR